MSNAYLSEMKQYLKDSNSAAQAYLKQLADMVFLECSPSAIKYILSKQGKCENILRLPLVPLSDKSQSVIDTFLRSDK